MVGLYVGGVLGAPDGFIVGMVEGIAVYVGRGDGSTEGYAVGLMEGGPLGLAVGSVVGITTELSQNVPLHEVP